MFQFNIRTLLFVAAYLAIGLAYTSYVQSEQNWDGFVEWNAATGEWQKRIFSNAETWVRSAFQSFGVTSLLFAILVAAKNAYCKREAEEQSYRSIENRD